MASFPHTPETFHLRGLQWQTDISAQVLGGLGVGGGVCRSLLRASCRSGSQADGGAPMWDMPTLLTEGESSDLSQPLWSHLKLLFGCDMVTLRQVPWQWTWMHTFLSGKGILYNCEPQSYLLWDHGSEEAQHHFTWGTAELLNVFTDLKAIWQKIDEIYTV